MVPRFAREEDIIREITTLVAEAIKVDEFILLRDEPVSVRVNCRDPSKIRNIVEIFFNGIGSDIKFIAENTQGRTQGKGRPSASQSKHDDKSGKKGGKDAE